MGRNNFVKQWLKRAGLGIRSGARVMGWEPARVHRWSSGDLGAQKTTLIGIYNLAQATGITPEEFKKAIGDLATAKERRAALERYEAEKK